MAKTAEELALEEQARAAQEAYRVMIMRQLGFDPTGIDRSTMNNMKDLENVIGGRIGSGQVVNPAAFEPTVSSETTQLPGSPLFDAYLDSPEGSIEKLAFDIFNEDGVSRFTAEDKLDTLLGDEPSEDSDEYKPWAKDRDRHHSVLSSLFDERDERAATIRGLGPEAAAADAAGQTSWSTSTSTPSKAAQSYYDDGLYLPTDKYTKDMFFRESSGDGQGGSTFDGGVGAAASARQQYMDILKARGDISVRERTRGKQATEPRERFGGGYAPKMRSMPEFQQEAEDFRKAAWSKQNAGLTGRAVGEPQWKQDRSGWTNADAASATASVAGRRSRDDLKRAEAMLAEINRSGRTPYQDQISMQMGQY